MKPETGLLVFKATAGWIQVGLLASDTFERGWIRAEPDNLIKGDQLTIPMRVGRMEGKNWSPAVRLNILRGIVRIGFTKEQVEIARRTEIGSDEVPDKESEETAAGVTET